MTPFFPSPSVKPCQDLDKAAVIVREHIARGIESRAFVGDPFETSLLPPPPGTDYCSELDRLIAQGDSVGDGLIQTLSRWGGQDIPAFLTTP